MIEIVQLSITKTRIKEARKTVEVDWFDGSKQVA